MYWAKDRNKLDKRIEFDSETGMVVILVLLQETTSRENPRRDKRNRQVTNIHHNHNQMKV